MEKTYFINTTIAILSLCSIISLSTLNHDKLNKSIKKLYGTEINIRLGMKPMDSAKDQKDPVNASNFDTANEKVEEIDVESNNLDDILSDDSDEEPDVYNSLYSTLDEIINKFLRTNLNYSVEDLKIVFSAIIKNLQSKYLKNNEYKNLDKILESLYTNIQEEVLRFVTKYTEKIIEKLVPKLSQFFEKSTALYTSRKMIYYQTFLFKLHKDDIIKSHLATQVKNEPNNGEIKDPIKLLLKSFTNLTKIWSSQFAIYAQLDSSENSINYLKIPRKYYPGHDIKKLAEKLNGRVERLLKLIPDIIAVWKDDNFVQVHKYCEILLNSWLLTIFTYKIHTRTGIDEFKVSELLDQSKYYEALREYKKFNPKIEKLFTAQKTDLELYFKYVPWMNNTVLNKEPPINLTKNADIYQYFRAILDRTKFTGPQEKHPNHILSHDMSSRYKNDLIVYKFDLIFDIFSGKYGRSILHYPIIDFFQEMLEIIEKSTIME